MKQKLFSLVLLKRMKVESSIKSDALIEIKKISDRKMQNLATVLKKVCFEKTIRECHRLPDHLSKHITQGLRWCKQYLPLLLLLGIRSAYICVKGMNKLQNTHPDVYVAFHKGFHEIRRSNKFCTCLSSDLVIEQTLMISLKSSGRLNNESYMNEDVRPL